jgi:hypothetical protein
MLVDILLLILLTKQTQSKVRKGKVQSVMFSLDVMLTVDYCAVLLLVE